MNLNYAYNSVVVLHDYMPLFRSLYIFDYEKNYNTKSWTRAVFPEMHAVYTGKTVPFKSEIPCRLTGICNDGD